MPRSHAPSGYQPINSRLARRLMSIQGTYYFVTGIWPLLDLHSFLAVTGPKEDIWLVRTFGVLTLAVGFGFLVSGLSKSVSRPMLVTAMSTALGLLIMDAYYVFHDVIWPTYLLDAIGQSILLLGWSIVLWRTFLSAS